MVNLSFLLKEIRTTNQQPNADPDAKNAVTSQAHRKKRKGTNAII
jgi:hypothetical protein